MKRYKIIFSMGLLLSLAAMPAKAVLVLKAPASVENASVVPIRVEVAPALKKGDILRIYDGDLPIMDVSLNGKAELSGFDVRFRLTHPRLSAVICGSRSEAVEKQVALGAPAVWAEGAGPDRKEQVVVRAYRNGILIGGKYSPEKHIGEISFSHGPDSIVFAVNHYLADSPRLIIQSNLTEYAFKADFKLNTAPDPNHSLEQTDRCALDSTSSGQGASYEYLDEATKKQRAAKGELVDTETQHFAPGDIRQYFGTFLLVSPDANWRACELDKRPTQLEVLESIRRSYRNRFGEIYAEPVTWVKARVVEGAKTGCEGWTHLDASILRSPSTAEGGTTAATPSASEPKSGASPQGEKPIPTWPVFKLGIGGQGLFKGIDNNDLHDARPRFVQPLNCRGWGGTVTGSEWYWAMGVAELRFNAAKVLITNGRDKGCAGWVATNFAAPEGPIPNDRRYLFQAKGAVIDYDFNGILANRKSEVCRLVDTTDVSVVERRVHRAFDAEGNRIDGQGYDLYHIIKQAVEGKGGCEGWVTRDQISSTMRR